MKVLKGVCRLVCSNSKGNIQGRTGGLHHKSAISDGLRKGSSKAGKVMAEWRWKKGKG